MHNESKYLLVETKVLPEVFGKVVQAKRLLAQGKAANLSEAAKLAGISRSALYKYKDSVHSYDEGVSQRSITISATLEDRPGVLSSLLGELYRLGANILTVNQNIPSDGVAHVSISLCTDPAGSTQEELIVQVGKLPGIVGVKLINSR